MEVAGIIPERWTPWVPGAPRGYAPLLGVELELSHEAGFHLPAIEAVRRHLDADMHRFLAAGVYDGSVSGAEFVTSPTKLEIHQAYWPRLIPVLRAGGFYAESGGGGLHVHCSRKAMVPGQLDLLVALTMLGGPEWEQFQMLVMGRTSERYAAGLPMSQARPESTPDSLERAHAYIREQYAGERQHDLRYQRINLMPKETVEFRQGHTTLNADKLLSRVECVHALLAFTRTAAKTSPLGHLFPEGLPSPRAFMGWVRRYKVWPHLAATSF